MPLSPGESTSRQSQIGSWQSSGFVGRLTSQSQKTIGDRPRACSAELSVVSSFKNHQTERVEHVFDMPLSPGESTSRQSQIGCWLNSGFVERLTSLSQETIGDRPGTCTGNLSVVSSFKNHHTERVEQVFEMPLSPGESTSRQSQIGC